MKIKSVDLKKELQLDNGGHIVYIFSDKLSYVENLTAYIVDGINLGQRVILIDHTEVYRDVQTRLLEQFSQADLQYVYFTENGQFYGIHDNFDCGLVAKNFEDLLLSLPSSGRVIRTWARVAWRNQEDIVFKLESNENIADDSVQANGILSVCAYHGTDISAELMVKVLKNHDYLMTDTELARSPLYARHKHTATFPSLSLQSKFESEIDLYKRKLDFIHVVSHEVRNPLTIVNGYAKLVRSVESNLSPDSVGKLTAIEQYAQAIDQELTHIIETEQMLSTELYMKLELIYPKNTVQEVIELMKIKSAIQNVICHWHADLDPTHAMMGNHLGLRLILSNLVSNAIKYTGERGCVELSARVGDNQIRFVIKDNGVGMSSSQLDSLYKKYGKFDDRKSGQGIGLYIVKNLTDRFNGRIHFVSQVGYGTQVTVDFPLRTEG